MGQPRQAGCALPREPGAGSGRTRWPVRTGGGGGSTRRRRQPGRRRGRGRSQSHTTGRPRSGWLAGTDHPPEMLGGEPGVARQPLPGEDDIETDLDRDTSEWHGGHTRCPFGPNARGRADERASPRRGVDLGQRPPAGRLRLHGEPPGAAGCRAFPYRIVHGAGYADVPGCPEGKCRRAAHRHGGAIRSGRVRGRTCNSKPAAW